MLAAGLQAQNKTERIQEIRKAYAEAKQLIADNGKSGERMEMKISVADGSEVSEDFIINEESEVVYYFKRMHLRGDVDLFDPRCYFLTEQTSANGHTSYREMLFDPMTHHLMFSFMKSETHAGFIMESRYYYDDLGQLIEEKHKADGKEVSADDLGGVGGGDQTMAMAYIVQFNDLMQVKGKQAEQKVAVTPTGKKAELMKQIRSLYADARKRIDTDAESVVPRNMVIEIHDQEDPAMPPQTDVIQFWFDYAGGDGKAHCYFMSSRCELGDHDVTSEYLFDSKDPSLLFCFSKQLQNDGPALEWRYYFDHQGRCFEAKGEEGKYGPGFADINQAKSYLEVFNMFLNPSN